MAEQKPKIPKTTFKMNDLKVEDVISVSKEGKVFLGEEQITETERKILKTEAHTFKRFRLYTIIQNTLKAQAVEKGINNSTQWEHVLAAKMMLHNLSIIEKIVETASNLKD